MRYTKITQPDFIDYSAKIPENLLYLAAQDINKKMEESDTLLSGINSLLNIKKIAPSEEAQRLYKNTTDAFIAEKNLILDDMQNNPSNVTSQNAMIKRLASKINDSYVNGELKALKEQGIQYYDAVASIKETYKDNPEIYNFHKDELDKNLILSPYNKDLNTFGKLQMPEMYKNYDVKDVQTFIDTATDEIAVKENITSSDAKRLLRTYTQDIYALSGKDRITAEKIYKSLAGAIPREFINSFNQYNKATKFYYPGTTILVDESQYDLGNKFNTNTRLGRMLDAAVNASEQNKTQILQKNKPQANGGSGDGNGSSGISTKDIYHSWMAHSAINQAVNAYKKASKNKNIDPDTYTATLNRLNFTINEVINQTLTPETWIKDQNYLKNGYVEPFHYGSTQSSNGIKNTFEDSDIRYYPDSNTLLILKPETKLKKGANINWNFDPLLNPVKPYSEFKLDNINDKNLAFKYLSKFGYEFQQFVPKLKITQNPLNLSDDQIEFLQNQE